MDTIGDMFDSFKSGNIRTLAKLISKIENEDPGKDEILKTLYPLTGRSRVVGVTGSPGAGKSSLVDRITVTLRKKGNTVGIIAVDPTSPFSGGALLGDRIRMQDHALDKGVYIRSMGTRGSLGGLARSTKEAVKLLDAFGFDWVIVETVGVGQAELDIMYVADTTLVVLTPGAGDSIQTIKAGIMEIADVFVVNKCDLPGADRVVSEIGQMLDLQKGEMDWRPPVIQVSTLDDRGMVDLMEAAETHLIHLAQDGRMALKRERMARRETLEIVDFRWQEMVSRQLDYKGQVNIILQEVTSRKTDPYTAADDILKYIIKNSDLPVERQTERKKGEELLEVLDAALDNLAKYQNITERPDFRSYLHGQVYGLAMALKILFPGPGNLGEKAAMAIRPAISEHSCRCEDEA